MIVGGFSGWHRVSGYVVEPKGLNDHPLPTPLLSNEEEGRPQGGRLKGGRKENEGTADERSMRERMIERVRQRGG